MTRPGFPTTPPAKMTPEIRQHLASLAKKIKSHHAALAACDSELPEMAARLERHNVEMQKAVTSCAFDDPTAIEAVVLAPARQRLLQNALRAIPGRRQQAMAELVATMREADKALAPFAAPEAHALNFADLKNSELARCDQAVSYIESKLNQ